MLHAAVVVALAVWVRTLATPSGVVAAAGYLVTAFVAWRGGRRFGTVAFALIGIATATFVIADARTQKRAAAVASIPAADRARPYQRALASAIEAAQRQLVDAATAVATGTSPASALPDLASDAALIVYEGDSAVDWAGRTVISTARLWERNGVVATPLYVVQYAVALHGARRAVATNVVAALPPADRLTTALTSTIGVPNAARYVVASVPLLRPVDGTVVQVGGSELLLMASVSDPQAIAAAAEQSSRSRGTALLLIAALVSLITLWHRAERIPERLGATAIPLAALAIAPLNALSNVTRLFDPATYYESIGGPFTASVGALGLTSALVLFAVMAAVRARAGPRQRSGAGLVVLVIAGVGPFLLRRLAEGVNLPPNGAGTGLWLAWELALFLAGTSLLAAGVTAGQRALGARRGIPLWIAPAIAAVAALLGPLLLQDSARWPSWYPVLWVLAIAALAVGRRSRAVLFPSAFVAACGATLLLWGATLRESVDLATRDVEGMANVDTGAVALLDRFAEDVVHSPAASDRERLLALYASSDLASVDYPVSLAYWPVDSIQTLLSLGADARFGEVFDVVQLARRTSVAQLRALTPNPAAALALAVPDPSGAVFSVVVGARTRLPPARTPGFAELLGLSGAPAELPYQLMIAGAGARGDSVRGPWLRRGDHLHSEWLLRAGQAASVRVVADVTFDPYETLVPRGLLIVMFDLFVVMALLLGDLLAEGAFVRWVRIRSSQWRRSYRFQLTFALLGFFVVPALTFGFWSYRRLQDDDRTSRELLVRETLRRAAIQPGSAQDDGRPGDATGEAAVPDIVNIPGDVPYFVYRDGQLVAARDSLLIALAPTGRWLEPSVGRLLRNADELVATTVVPVGKRGMLFGFRSLSPEIVAAVPARQDDVSLDKRRRDLGVLIILTTLLGGLAALWLSGVAARQLARPIATLRGAALAVAGGSRAPLRADDVPLEFVPVFRAFDRMARDLAESEAHLTRAERVFAWGEMARQVAHEIKNPLTPIRLGVQHVQRAWRDRRPDFGSILEDNAARVLREIDHLDETARSFSRFGTPPDAPVPVENIDVSAVARDVTALEALGSEALAWGATGAESACWARARPAELREVLLNLCENARIAGARSVEIRVERAGERVILSVVDDGEGVPPQLHARVFEPHFSTHTSGSGLGLAISRRLVEGWGGSIDLDSKPGVGTSVRLTLEAGDADGAAPTRRGGGRDT